MRSLLTVQKRKLPVVLCTTGLSEEQLAKVEETAKKCCCSEVCKYVSGNQHINEAASGRSESSGNSRISIWRLLRNIIRLKVDAPSGTALALADSINEAMDNQYHYTYDRSQRREMRDDKEIGISAVRGGTIVGEHDVIFAGPDEVIEFKHTAYSKAVFGKGAIEAAKFLAGKPAGRYDMSDVISAK